MLQVLPAPPQPTGFADLGGVLLQAGRDYQANAIRKEQEAQQEKLEQERLQNQLVLQQQADAAALTREKAIEGMRLDNEKSLMDLKNRAQILQELHDKGYLKLTDLQGAPDQVTAAITQASIRYQQDTERARNDAVNSRTNAQATVNSLSHRNAAIENAINQLQLQGATPQQQTPTPAEVMTRATQLAQLQKDQEHHFLGISLGSNTPSKQEIAAQVPAAQQELTGFLAQRNAESDRSRKVLLDSLQHQLADNRSRIDDNVKTFHVAPTAEALAASPTDGSFNLAAAGSPSGSPLAPGNIPLPPPALSIANFLSSKTGTAAPSGAGANNIVLAPQDQPLPTTGVSDPQSLQLIQQENARRQYNAYQAPIDEINRQLSELDEKERTVRSASATPPAIITMGQAFTPNFSASTFSPADSASQAAELSQINQKRAQLKQQLQSLQSSMPQTNVNPMPALAPTPAQPAAVSQQIYAAPGMAQDDQPAQLY